MKKLWCILTHVSERNGPFVRYRRGNNWRYWTCKKCGTEWCDA